MSAPIESLAPPLFRPDGPGAGREAAFRFDGRRFAAPEGISVAAALLVSGIHRLRTTPVSGASRAPFCMMGVCFDCLVRIDGVPNRQACLVPLRDGMVVEEQQGAADVGDAAPGGGHGQ